MNIKETEHWTMGFGESCAASLSPTRPPCRPVTKALMSGAAEGFHTQVQPAALQFAEPWAPSRLISTTTVCVVSTTSYLRFSDEKSRI